MEAFTVLTKLTPGQYGRLFARRLYRRPATILITIIGLFILFTSLLDVFHVIYLYDDPSVYYLAGGVFFLLFPLLIVLAAIRQFRQSPGLLDETYHTFDEEGMKVKARAFKGEFSWILLQKYRESGHFLVLYHTKTATSIIDKTQITPAQLDYIKSKVDQAVTRSKSDTRSVV